MLFTAIVLVCAGEILTPENCYVYTNERLFQSRKECRSEIEYAIKSNVFRFFDELTLETHDVKDYYCVDWNAKRV